MKTYHLHITGKVQGVWYRASAKDKALSLGLKGKVWNEHDGTVAALVQGSEEAVQAFVDWCHEGPVLAEVNSVVVNEEPGHEVFVGFSISKGR